MLYLVAFLTAASVALLVLSFAGAVSTRPASVARRVAALQTGRRGAVLERRRRQARRERLRAVVEAMGRRMGRLGAEKPDLRLQLLRAGYRKPAAPYVYTGGRLVAAAGLAGLVFLLYSIADVRPAQAMVAPVAGGGLGWMLPRLLLSRRVRRRQSALQKALPDTLDLIVICVEAGLGLNQALARVSEEVESVSSEMSDELAIVNLEIQAGKPREEALRNLGERTDVADLRSLVTVLVQTERFGTSVARALRVQADNLRTKRRQRAEEAAAKTTIKMIFPLVLFIFPAMFVVILGPAVFHLLELFRSAA